ncbi:MAG: hypothetical protein ACJAUY_001638 [Cognaticolwellia sp.]|jgi:hypothetical protein
MTDLLSLIQLILNEYKQYKGLHTMKCEIKDDKTEQFLWTDVIIK